MKNLSLIIFSVLMISFGNSSPKPKWIFGIHKTITPNELEDNGFETTMNHNGPHCTLDKEGVFVSIGLTATNKIEQCGIAASEIIFSEVGSL